MKVRPVEEKNPVCPICHEELKKRTTFISGQGRWVSWVCPKCQSGVKFPMQESEMAQAPLKITLLDASIIIDLAGWTSNIWQQPKLWPMANAKFSREDIQKLSGKCLEYLQDHQIQ